MEHDVFQYHDGVVNHQTHCGGQASQGHQVEALSRQLQHDQREQQGNRYHEASNKRGSPIAQENHQNDRRENQTEQDVAVVNAAEALPTIRPSRITFSAYSNRADFRLSDGAIVYENQPVLRLADTKLRGLHNIENLMATLAVGVARGLSFAQMVPAIRDYEPRPHRCEFVRELDGVEYVNDSKATNLDAVEKALAAQTKPTVLIAGGKDKGFTFDPLRSLVKEKVKSAVLIGEMAPSIKRSWDDAIHCDLATSLADAVERARGLARPGDVVLFSPGTSSFDMFKSYSDRGDQFRSLVQALPQ